MMVRHETRMNTVWTGRAVGFSVLLLLIAAWQAVVTLGWISPFLLPPPSQTAAALPRLLLDEGLAGKFVSTFATTFAATAIASTIGIGTGWLLYRRPLLGRAYESWLGAAFSAPLILLYPLFMVVFGRGVKAILVMGIVAGVVPVALATSQGLRAIPQVYLNVARSMQMSERQLALKVLLPAALPSIFTGIRLCLIYAMIYIVAIEYLVDIGGLGAIVGDLYDRYDIPGMAGAIVFVVLASVVFFVGVEKLERWLSSL
jgi:ABC-type nitrate/sulfonate/bicarbonate transport system permease component